MVKDLEAWRSAKDRDRTLDQSRLDAQERILACFDQLRSNLSDRDMSLDLSGLRLGSLPGCIGNLTGLKKLFLNGNRLKTLPESIGKLAGLEELDIAGNCLDTLPESIGNLAGLKYLYIQVNRLKNLPEGIGNLTNLKFLILRINALESLPECISNLTGLEELCLYNNRLESLPEGIGSLTNLKGLNLGENALESLPECISNLTNLKGLNLGENALESLPGWISNLTGLERLSLTGNRLESLPEGIGNLTGLRELRLSSNPLTTLPRSLIELPSGCEIRLYRVPLPPVVIDNLSSALEVQRARHPGTGPTIFHSMPALPAPPRRSLPDEISSWYAESGSKVASGAAWAQAITAAGLDQDSKAALSSLLGRLRVTAHYRVAPVDMQQRVHAILEQLKSDKNALASCAAQAVEGLTGCDDRIALALLMMEETLLHHKAQRAAAGADGPQTLRTIGQGLYKSDVLKAIANRRVAAASFVDPTEYILKYWVKLSDELDLPCKLQDMIFPNLATAVSDDDINAARKEVRSAVSDAARFERFLANWTPWQTLLEHHLPEDHKETLKQVEAFRGKRHEELEMMRGRLGEIHREKGELSDDYLNLSAEIGAMSQRIQDFRTECFETLSKKLGETRP